MKQPDTLKLLQELPAASRFLFTQCLLEPKIAKQLLEAVLLQEVKGVQFVSSQYDREDSPIRISRYIKDRAGNAYGG